MAEDTPVLIQTAGLAAGYGDQPVVRDLAITVRAGEVVVLLGPNGAGKTTTILALAGELPVMAGTVELFGQATVAPLHKRVRQGLAYIPEERSVFPELSTAANLRVGRVDNTVVFEHFPELETLQRRAGGLLSGGEQRMLSVGRALARKPRLLLADELSLGLAPLIVDRLAHTIREAADDGLGVLLVEQRVHTALAIADRVYFMSRGEIVLDGAADEVRERVDQIEAGYFHASDTAPTP